MAKKASKRFLIPDEDELDQPIETIKKGSTFATRENHLSQTKESNFAGFQKVGDGLARELHQIENSDEAKVAEGIEKRSPNKRKKLEAKSTDSSTDIAKNVMAKNADGEKVSVKEGSSMQTNTVKSATNSIIVNSRQRGNPVLKFIRNVPWEFGETVADYALGQTVCALFLSLRYHNFNPDYVHQRLKELGNRFELRILLVLVDVKDAHGPLRELSKICILSDCTLILSWSNEEAGRYLETYKCYENKPADMLQERTDGDHYSKMIDCLTSVKSVNKTDAVTLMTNFGSLHSLIHSSKEEISLCPGFGPQKAERIHKIFQEPFIRKNRKEKS